jgi:heterodisulfide reductase subunit D
MYIEEYLDTINAWRFCPMCNHVCPVIKATKNEANGPRGLALSLFLVSKGMRQFDEPRVHRIYQCTTSGVCEAWSLGGYDLSGMVLAGRADVVDQDKVPLSALRTQKNIESMRNPFGEARETKSKLATKLNEESGSKKNAAVLYFMGCTAAYRQPEIAKASVKVLHKAGVNFTLLEDEPCCGAPLYELGFRDHAKREARELSQLIAKSTCNQVITSCPHCYRALTEWYPQLGVPLPADVKVKHTADYFSELAKDRNIRLSKRSEKVTYHDPCYLGRFGKVFEQPRELIKEISGPNFKEMKWNREKALCCGAGGGMPFTNPKIAAQIGDTLIGEVAKTGSEILITACPLCSDNLAPNKEKLKSQDISQFLADSLAP